jgi:fucose 4-O-acetylase-like acetyltransferase
VSENCDTELKNVGFVKTFLMITVVAYHSILFWNGNWFYEEPVYAAPLLSVLSKWLNSFHVSGFTLVSGYIFSYIFYEKKGYSNFKSFVGKKCKRLLIPYFFVTFLWIIPVSYPFYHFSSKDIFTKYVLGVSPSQLWFILMLFNVFVIAYPVFTIIKNKLWIAMPIAVLLYGVGIVGEQIIPNYFQIFSAFKFFSYFVIGVFLRFYKNKFRITFGVLTGLLFIHGITFALSFQISEQKGMLFSILQIGVRYLMCSLGAFNAFYLLQKIASKINLEGKVFVNLSKCSMTVFLFHQQLIYLPLYLLNGKINPYFHSGINFVFSVSISLLISSILLHFKVTKFMIGEKT